MTRLASAVSGDEAAIAALCEELDRFYGDVSQGTPEERAAQVREALFGDQPLARALLAWDGDVLAGLASYSFLWPAAGLSTSLYLKELYVAEAYQRAGLGEELMRELHAIAERQGCSRVEWTTDTVNPGARAFYAKLGVKPKTSKIFYRSEGDLACGPASS